MRSGILLQRSYSDFWATRTMVTPVIIQILFWIGASSVSSPGL
jgi:hypothetical protein